MQVMRIDARCATYCVLLATATGVVAAGGSKLNNLSSIEVELSKLSRTFHSTFE